MSTIPPITGIPVIGYPDFTPYTQITPFTVRDGATYLLTLEALKDWIRDVLVPQIDAQIAGLGDAWSADITDIVNQTNQTVTDLTNAVNTAIAGITDQVEQADAARDAAQAAQTASESARDEAANYASTVVAYQDANVEGFVNDAGSATGGALRSIFATIATLNAQISRIDFLTGSVGPAGRGVVYMVNYPRLAGETDDSAALTRAIADAASKGANIIEFGASITLAAAVNCNVDNMTFRGATATGTNVNITADVTVLNVTGNYNVFENFRFYNNIVPRTVFPIVFNGANQGQVRRCYIVSDSGGRFHGVRFTGGSMAVVEGCTFSHACIRVETWDVKIRNSWVWAMSNDYGIGIFNGAGNIDITEVDVVPPLQTTGTGIAGILIDGTTGSNVGIKLNTVFIDGNPTLQTRKGIVARGGSANINMVNISSSRCDDDVITIDSCYNVIIDGYNGYNNNNSAGATGREIVVIKTGTQGIESVRLANISCVMTAAALGTAQPAIYVDDSVGAWQVTLDGFNIKQPGAGGGYVNPEVRVPKDANGYPIIGMRGKGQLSWYHGEGSQVVNSGATTATINLGVSPFALGYRPNPARIRLGFDSTAIVPAYRITYNSDSQILVTFASALTANATAYWSVNFAAN